MADYFDIEDDELVPDAPLASLLGFRFRDNPIAQAEGAPGAPRQMPASLDLYLGTITLSGTTAAGLTGLDGLDGVLCFFALSNSTVSNNLQLRFSDDGGATWGSWQTLFAVVGSDSDPDGFSQERSPAVIGLISGVNTQSKSGALLTIPGSGANAMQFRFSSNSWSGRAYVFGFGTTA